LKGFPPIGRKRNTNCPHRKGGVHIPKSVEKIPPSPSSKRQNEGKRRKKRKKGKLGLMLLQTKALN